MTAVLETVDLQVSYGAVRAVLGVTLSVGPGDVVALLGANGAGKTSTVRASAGLVRAAGGKVRWEGQDVTNWQPHRLVRAGLAVVPEGRRVFAPMTVEENLELGAFTNRSAASRKDLKSEMYDMFPALAQRRHIRAGLLSGGEQQMLAFGRALMSKPKVVMMDEPSIGLSPVMVERVMRAVADIGSLGIGVLLVEQNAVMALSVAQTGIVLERGKCVLSGDSESLRNDPGVVAAFLGDSIIRDSPEGSPSAGRKDGKLRGGPGRADPPAGTRNDGP